MASLQAFLLKQGLILPVILPFGAALLLVTLGALGRGFRFFAVGAGCATGLSFLIAVFLALHVSVAPRPLLYDLGGWAVPLGIGYCLDGLSSPFLLLVTFLATLTCFQLPLFAQSIQEDKQGLFYALFLLCVGGLCGLVLTADAFNAFVFLEISSLTSYALVAFGNQCGMQGGGQRRGIFAAYNYLLTGSMGASFFVIGVGFLYMETGSLSIVPIREFLAANSAPTSGVVKVAFCFLTIGLLLKCFVFFVHRLMPQIYTAAPGPIVAFFSGTTTKVLFYLLVRFLFDVFGLRAPFEVILVKKGLLILGSVGVLVPALFACFENDLRRILAYSSLSQISYLFLALAASSRLALSAALIHVFAHAFAKSGLFMTASILEAHSKGLPCLLSKQRGCLRKHGLLAFSFAIFCASLAGMPFTFGFLGKWYFLEAFWKQRTLFLLLVVASLLAFIYAFRLVLELVIFSGARGEHGEELSVSKPMAAASVLPIGLLLVASTVCLLGGASVYAMAHTLAERLVGGLNQ